MPELRVGRAVITFWLLTLAYVGLLLWVDRSKGLLSGFERLYAMLPFLMFISLASYLARYARWHWLLARAGANIRPLRGFAAYLSGFAFTATPGKVGELLRIRYFQPMGAPPELVLSAFVYERLFDLIVVLCLAGIAAANFGVFPVVLAFVVIVLAIVFLLTKYPSHLLRLSTYLERRQMRRLARLAEIFAHGFAHTRVWLTPLDLLVSLVAGLVAWGLTAYAFVLLLEHLALGMPKLLAFSLYPVAMLAGAASMMPGGIGSTEAVLVILLAGLGVSLANGTIAAIGIRLATLWFATLVGLLSMLALEWATKSGTAASSRRDKSR
ncbi:MAG: lysylphosphatidylglycerol synthase transmembrane domain-containing protein [Gallionellaceae bacterium]|nr:lysylphosphatidylglycerol synthase transmembrane domain-containing protein [Gallionellaceae bacterium]